MAYGERSSAISSVEELSLLKQKTYGSMIIAGVEAHERYLSIPSQDRVNAQKPEADPIYLDCVAAHEEVCLKLEAKIEI